MKNTTIWKLKNSSNILLEYSDNAEKDGQTFKIFEKDYKFFTELNGIVNPSRLSSVKYVIPTGSGVFYVGGQKKPLGRYDVTMQDEFRVFKNGNAVSEVYSRIQSLTVSEDGTKRFFQANKHINEWVRERVLVLGGQEIPQSLIIPEDEDTEYNFAYIKLSDKGSCVELEDIKVMLGKNNTIGIIKDEKISILKIGNRKESITGNILEDGIVEIDGKKYVLNLLFPDT